MLKCVSCGDDIKTDSYRECPNAGDCHPLCVSCALEVERTVVNRQSLIRKLYSAGRGVSCCQACRAEGYQEIHFIRPICKGGELEATNILILCPFCHDKVHEPGARITLKVKKDER